MMISGKYQELVITKAGSGTLTFSGNNTYTGDTTISAGTLKLTGTLADTTDSNKFRNI